MICISIGENGYDKTQKVLKKVERLKKTYPNVVAEVRLDLCNLTLKETHKLFYSSKIPLIATSGKSNMNHLQVAINAGADYVCINLLNSKKYIQNFKSKYLQNKTKLILSYVNYKDTPVLAELKRYYQDAIDKGADIVRISCNPKNAEDVERLLYLYKYQKFESIVKIPLIAYSYGEIGKYSRYESYNLGSYFTYCVLNKKSIISKGQILYKDFLSVIDKAEKIDAEVMVPSSSSMAQRVIISAAISKGISTITNVFRCKDVDSAIEIAKQLGANVKIEGDNLIIRGRIFPNKKKKEDNISSVFPSSLVSDFPIIHAGTSGLLARILLPLLSMSKDKYSITGEGVLLNKDLSGTRDVLEELDGNCILSEDNTLPAVVSGPLEAVDFTVSGNSTSQLITGLLMALPLAKKDLELEVKDITSIDYVFLTLRILKMFGIKIKYKFINKDVIFKIPSKQKYLAANIDIDGDRSLASNFIACAAIFGKIKLKGLKSSIKLKENIFLDIVRESGGYVEEKKSYIVVESGHLSHFSVDVNAYSDLIPILVVLAIFSEGESVLTGIVKSRIYVRSRIINIIEEFSKMGVDLRMQDDNLFISGMTYSHRILENNLLKGGNYDSHGDHRIAMALSIASLGSKEKFIINGIEAVDKSYPTFNTVLNEIKSAR